MYPSARAASRSELGTIWTISSVVRVTVGIIIAPSASAPASAEKWPIGTTTSSQAKIPITIEGSPFSTSARKRMRTARGESLRSAR